MTEPTRKRRLCSHDMAEVPPECYWLGDPKGPSYFCDARCLCLWSVQFATKPNLPEDRKKLDVDLVMPSGSRLHVTTLTGLAWWAVENMLGHDDKDAMTGVGRASTEMTKETAMPLRCYVAQAT